MRKQKRKGGDGASCGGVGGGGDIWISWDEQGCSLRVV